MNLEVVCATGGTSLRDDILRFRRDVHVVVATPGRILDLAQHKVARLSRCSMVVMDEADKLLSADFVRLIEKILAFAPTKDRQLMLYSATFPASVKTFCDKWLSIFSLFF